VSDPRRFAPTEGPGPAPDAGSQAHRPRDERHREIGVTLIQRVVSLIRMGKAYQVENQVFSNQLDDVMAFVQPILEEAGEVVLVSLDSDFYLNGMRIPMKANRVKFQEVLLTEFGSRGIAGVKIEKGVKTAEMMAFFKLFFQPDVYHGTGLLEACIAQGADRVLPVIHASTDSAMADDLRTGAWFGFEQDAGADAWRGGNVGPVGRAVAFGRGPANELTGAGPAAPRGAVSKNYALAMVGTRSLLTTTSVQSGLEVRHAKRVIQPIVDGAFADEPVVLGLTTLGHHDEYTYAHAVNVCLVATSMGRFLEMDRRALADLSVAALLHDVGKGAFTDRIKNAIDAFTPEEREMCQRHPVEGAKTIARTTTLNATTLRCLRTALEHHANADGSGYPVLPSHWRTSLLARLVAIADCFVSLQTHRTKRGLDITPYEALGMMLGPMAKKFDPALLWALVQTVGLYPPGQLVELDDTSIGVVLAPTRSDPTRPSVRILREPNGEYVRPDKARVLKPIPNDMQVRRAFKGTEYQAILEGAEAALGGFQGFEDDGDGGKASAA
jgi:HD-GYP domain-containing protein (c-di-GMP phosphodiesterase class II)